MGRLDDILAKGNVWYVRHFEAYFDEVVVLYLVGSAAEQLTRGRTRLISVAGRSGTLNKLLAPIRLFVFAMQFRPTVMLTADQTYAWWTTLLTRLLSRRKVVLMPVSIPEQLYRDSGATTSRLPIFWERILIALSYACAYRVLTTDAFGSFVEWLRGKRAARRKLLIVPCLPDALPSEEFFSALGAAKPKKRSSETFELVYVGRLHPEKLVDHLIRVMETLRNDPKGAGHFRLNLIGDGAHREYLKKLAIELDVADNVIFHGAKPQDKLPELLLNFDAFVSTLTGTSLREAALCGLPVIAYDRDWVHGFLRHDDTALLVPSGDITEFAFQIRRLAGDDQLRDRLAAGMSRLAAALWSPAALEGSLEILEAAVQ